MYVYKSHKFLSCPLLAGSPYENVPQESELHWVLGVTPPYESPVRIQHRPKLQKSYVAIEINLYVTNLDSEHVL